DSTINDIMPKANAITDYRLTDHAEEQMARRQISEEMVAQVLSAPEQSELVRPGREVHQSRIGVGDPPNTYLLRVFVEVDRNPPEVVTVYLTSKIDKYWRTNS